VPGEQADAVAVASADEPVAIVLDLVRRQRTVRHVWESVGRQGSM